MVGDYMAYWYEVYTQIPDVGCRMSDVECRMSDVGCRMSDVGFSQLCCRISCLKRKFKYFNRKIKN